MHNSGKSGRIVAEVVGSDLNQQLTSSDHTGCVPGSIEMPSGLLASHHVQNQQGQLPAPSLAMSERSPPLISYWKRISSGLFLKIINNWGAPSNHRFSN